MSLEPPKQKAGAQGGEKGGGGGGAGGGGKRFQVPEGYFEAYLASGGGMTTEVDFAELRDKGEVELAAKDEGTKFEKAYGAWLWRDLGLFDFVQKFSKPAPPPDRKAVVERMSRLAPFDRKCLMSAMEALALLEKLTGALGPEGAAQLVPGTPPPRDEGEDKKEDAQEDKPKDEKKEASGEEEAKEKDDKAKKDESKAVKGGLFEQLFAAALEKKKAEQPDLILAQLRALDDRSFEEVTRQAAQREAWTQLIQAVGPRLTDEIARRRYEPLGRALATFTDGVCEPGERTRILQWLHRSSPFERAAVEKLVAERGTGRQLAQLFGPELTLWLSGGVLAPEKREPEEEPEAALTAARRLKPATLRRLEERLSAGATGPVVLEALADELELFVDGYWSSVTKPDPQRRNTSKQAVAALARVDANQLRLMAWSGEREGQEPSESPAGAAAVQFDALFKPFLAGAPTTAESKEKTLKAVESLSLGELTQLLTQLGDGVSVLEAALGARFGAVAGERLYKPLADVLAQSPGDDGLPEADRERRLLPLFNLTPWAKARLVEKVGMEASGPRLATLFGEALARVGLESLTVGPRPPGKPRYQVTAPQRKAALDAFKRITPDAFAKLLKDTKLATLQRYATALIAVDEELARALLKPLPSGEVEPGNVDPAVEEAELRGFFERLVADQRGKADDGPRPMGAAAPERKKKREGDEEDGPVGDDGLDVETLASELAGPHVDPGGQMLESSPDQRRKTADTFKALPPSVKEQVKGHLRESGTWEHLKKVLGPELE